MPLTVFDGLPGAGKSKALIERVEATRAAGRQALTFVCSDSAWTRLNYGQEPRVLTCREHGLTCALDHLVASVEAAKILDQVPAGALAAFEEAHCFAPVIAEHWKTAARRGVDVLICTPSPAQKVELRSVPRREIAFIVSCQRCDKADATRYVIPPGQSAPATLCDACYEVLAAEARRAIVEQLRRNRPQWGSPTMSRPAQLNSDSRPRVECMERVIRDSVELADAVRQYVPEGARVLVVSGGDDWLVKLEGSCGVHFPADRTGIYRGYYPEDSAEAIALLDAERRKGAQFIVFPKRTAWWLDFYDDLRKHLDQHDTRIPHNATCVIYKLMTFAV